MSILLAGVQLVPDGSILIHIALILLMIFVLNRTFFRPVNQVLEARERQKRTNLTEAETILLEAKKNREKLETELLQARNEGYKLVEQIRKQTVEEVQEKVRQAREEISKRVTEEKAEIKKQAEKAKKEILAEAKDLAEKISNSVLS
ncbi:MAG: hypothetical protein RML33_00765 [Acidobacteriota bacterium]|nr:hypothetical protein [Pyrinomonadaceae bacterium]MDW8303357.1 hypothetical protein [Acidobacteriota bacterium]